MTKSVTPADPTRAGAKSKPHHHKQKVEKIKEFSKILVSRRNRLKISTKKKENF